MTNRTKNFAKNLWRTAILWLLLPLIIVLLPVALVLFLIEAVILRLLIWCWWCPRGKDILFVYSNSPIWHDYIEQHFLPRLGDRAVLMNWSERKRWRISLAKIAFRHFGGPWKFNPLAVVFHPCGRTHIFRFWQPFRDFKHGHPEALHKIEHEFFQVIGVS
jgi:hypothetical protein